MGRTKERFAGISRVWFYLGTEGRSETECLGRNHDGDEDNRLLWWN